ncbi:hypothetical protein MNBD_CHLOROFLEXI01-26 [hydrothermal vent metagenome]|uniref:Uncharacterized protein n=1 Tax=hydrothermal vent metagenome TaxID=652676 RepID=A0A3B0W9L8_9ZZZZ
MNMKQTEVSVPKLKKFWQRAIFFFVLSIFFSLLIGWILSLYDPYTLSQTGSGTGRRRATIRLMLTLMTPVGWGWFIFGLMFIGSIVGDWYSYRFKDLPD